MSKPVCTILGAGPGNGLAMAKRFADGGCQTILCARDAAKVAALAEMVPGAASFPVDVTDGAAVRALFATLEQEFGPTQTLLYNAGSGSWGDIDKLEVDEMHRDFATNAAGLFLATQAVLPQMRRLGGGNIIVTGASAAWRGRPGSISFAAAKAAQRSVAQSLARQLGPEGIHVAYMVLDGVIDLERSKAAMPDKPATFFMSATGVAGAAWALCQQDRQAWTFELDLRPFAETW